MEKNPKIGICGSYIQSFDDRGNLDIRKYATNDAVLRANIFKYSPVAQPSAAVRREAFDKVGVFNEKYPPAEDIDISFRIGELYEFANIPEVLLKYREHPQSATYKKLKKQIASTLEVRKKYIYNSEYRFGVTDYLAYALTSIMQFAPYNITMPLFKFMRNVINKTYL